MNQHADAAMTRRMKNEFVLDSYLATLHPIREKCRSCNNMVTGKFARGLNASRVQIMVEFTCHCNAVWRRDVRSMGDAGRRIYDGLDEFVPFIPQPEDYDFLLGNGCQLSDVFVSLALYGSQAPCIGCAYLNTCKSFARCKAAREAGSVPVSKPQKQCTLTNAQIAAEMGNGVTKRQVAKMRQAGTLPEKYQ